MNNKTNEREVNTHIGCNVTGCKYNSTGKYCTLNSIQIIGGCNCTKESETCCDSFKER